MRMLKGLIVMLTAALALSGGLAAQKAAGSADALLRMAADKATVDGDLNAAIKQYQAIVDRYSTTDRRAAATALVRMAECYQKLGNAEATKIYQRVLKNFGDQPAAAEARAQLGARSVNVESSEPHLVQRLDAKASEFSLSPDGRTIAMYGLVLLDVTSGRATNLGASLGLQPFDDRAAGTWADSEWPVLSADSKQVAYVWHAGDGNKNTAQLRMVTTTPGSKPRTLVDNPEFSYFVPVGWSREGSSLLVMIVHKDNTDSLAWVSLSDGSVRTLKSLGWRMYGARASLSPDGRYIAYSALTASPDKRLNEAARKSAERHIYVLAADASSETELTRTAAVSDSSPVWTADGSHIVFSSNRSGSGTFGLWSIPVKDGKAVGSPSQLRGNTGDIEPIGISRTGTLYYTSYADGPRTISIAAVSLGNSTTPQVTDSVPGTAASWSHDGKTLAMMRPSGDGGSAPKLVLHSIETGEERSYSHDRLLLTSAHWFHDGKRLLVAVADNLDEVGGNAGLGGPTPWYSLDRQTGKWTKVLPADPQRGPVYIGPDDQAIFYIARSTEPGKPSVVMKIDLATGAKTQVFDFATLPKGGHAVGNLSPDGRMWAIRSSIGTDTGVHLVSLNDGSYRELYRGPDQGNVRTGLQWSSDSRTIYWGENDTVNEGGRRRIRVKQIAASGGPVQFSGVEFDGGDNSYTVMSPDGSHVVLQTYGGRQRELWAIDNIPALLKAPR